MKSLTNYICEAMQKKFNGFAILKPEFLDIQDDFEDMLEDNEIKIDPITHLIAPKNGKIKVNQTALWRTLTHYVDTKNDAEIKFLYKNFKEDFIKGYKCLTKNRIKYIDMIIKVEA